MTGVMKPTSTLLPTEVQLPTATKSVPTTVQFPTSTKSVDESVDELIKIIEASDPASSTYNPESAAYAGFPGALKQLAALNSSTNNAASMLAYAFGFPRQDSILAAQALISLGPDWAATTLPTLIMYLKYQQPEVRIYSAIVLSTIGEKASCSLGNIGPLLWDTDPYVRSSAALAIQGITGKELVANIYVITPDHLSSNPVAADTPEGKIVGAARMWWTDHGSQVNWHPSYDLCDP
jgi:HEAT repeat protein